MTEKAKAASKRIAELQHGKRVGGMKMTALNNCAQMYKTILEADIPEAIEALEKGDPKFAEDGTNDAANEATYCEEDFPAGQSPITQFNKDMHDVSAIAAAITRLLL